VLDSPRNGVSISGRNKTISYKTLSPNLGSTNLPAQILLGFLFLGVERQAGIPDHPPPPRVEIKNKRIYNFIPSYAYRHGD